MTTIFTPETYGAQGDTRIVSATITASGTSVAAGTAIFSASDVGKYVSVGGCGYQVAEDAVQVSGGHSYSSYDQLTPVGGSGPKTALIVVNQTSGVVSSVNQFYAIGQYVTVPANPVSTTGGTGTGATFNITWRSLAHTAKILSVAADNKSVTVDVPVIVSITASLQKVYIGTDDGAAIDSCITAAVMAAATSAVSVKLSGSYTVYDRQISTYLVATSNPFSIVGNAPNARLHFAQQTGNKWCLVASNIGEIVLAGSGGISADAPEGARTISLNPTISPSVSKGDYLCVTWQTNAGMPRGFAFRVTNKNGNDVEMSEALPFAIDHNQPGTVSKYNPADNVEVRDVIIDGFGTITEYTVGLALYQANNSYMKANLRNFWTFNSCSFASYEVTDSEIDVHAKFGAGGDGANAIAFGYCTACDLKAESHQSYGFGIGLNLSAWNNVEARASNSKGRMVKLYGSCSNTFSNVECSDAQAGFVGLAFTYASSGNIFRVVRASNCGQGVWSDGTGNKNNTISAYYYAGNAQDIALAPNDSRFDIYCCPCPTTKVVVDGSTGSSIRQSIP